MPFVLCFCLAAFLFRNKDKQKARPIAEVEEQMPLSVQMEVYRCLTEEQSPDALRSFASAIAPRYPKAAFELRCQAWVLGGRQGEFPTFAAA